MFRPFLFIVLFFISGILSANILKQPGIIIILNISLAFLIIFRKNRIRLIFIGLLILSMGAFYNNFKVDRMIGEIIDFSGKNRTVVGVVSDAPELNVDKITYTVRALYLIDNDSSKRVTGMILLSTPRDKKHDSTYNYGDVIRFSGELKIPKGKRNPGGFDYKAHLMRKGISTTMFSRDSQKIGEYDANPFLRAAFSFRERLMAFYDAHLPEELSSLISGMILGIKGRISGDVLRAFSNAGIIHILAVSGLHVGIVFGAAVKLMDLVKIPNTISFCLGSLIILFYCFVTGLPPSVVRASIMIWITMLGSIVGRRGDAVNNLSFAAFVTLLINPANLYTLGFQLSFAATLGIVLFYTKLKKLLPLPGYIRDMQAVVCSAQIIVLPILAYHFHNISLIVFLTNLILVPIASIALVTGFVGGILGLIVPPAGVLIIHIGGLLMTVIQKTSVFLGSLPFSTITVPSFPAILVLIYYILLLFVFGNFKTGKKLKKYKIAAITAFIIILVVILIPKQKSLEVTFIDVGQGDSILIRTPNKMTVLIDGGGMPAFYQGDFDVGRDVIEPFLQSKGVRSIQVMVFSHFDSDHSEGLIYLLENMKVDTILYGIADQGEIYKRMKLISDKKGIRTIQLARGDEFIVDGILFEILSPPKGGIPGATDNDNSLVLKMTYKDISFLFTGDLGHAGEYNILESGIDIKSTVLKVGHHGSGTSTSPEFLRHVKPVFAVISVESGNRFGHPSPQVIDLLNGNGIRILRTDLHGGVTFKVTEKDVNIFTTLQEGQ